MIHCQVFEKNSALQFELDVSSTNEPASIMTEMIKRKIRLWTMTSVKSLKIYDWTKLALIQWVALNQIGQYTVLTLGR